MSEKPAVPTDPRRAVSGSSPGGILTPSVLPFSQRFHRRGDEEVGLRALFEKVFYGVEIGPGAREALSRFRFQPGSGGEARESGAEAFEATPYILLNRGETGIGKTRVFRQFRLTAAERRIPVYEIHCYDVEGIPFKPILEVVREILRDFELSGSLRDRYRQVLEELFPARPGTPPGFSKDGIEGPPREPGGGEAEMVRVFDALTQLLFEITALKPVVILVHDLHWGDRGTIELLRYIGRNLQLRNSRLAAAGPRSRRDLAGPLPSPRGPELGDDSGEWRELTSRAALGLESLTEPGTAAAERSLLDAAEASVERPVRLMVLANYRGSPDAGHYLERAIRSLGEEPFVFHGEIRTLTPEEARDFVERSLAGPADAGGDAVDPEAQDLIYRWSEGFPSYIHELLRLIFLAPEWEAEPRGPDGKRLLSRAVIERALGRFETPAPPVEARPEARTPPPSKDRAAAARPPSTPPPPAPPPRMRILERRLATLSPSEREPLVVLALARKPLPAHILEAVLLDRAGDEPLEAVLSRLEDRHFIERVRHEYPRRGEETGYYFRIADYPQAASAAAAPEVARLYHERLGERCREIYSGESDEKAFETFYHLRLGGDPLEAIPFGLRAAHRLARSFSLEKAVQVCDQTLEILASPAPAGPAPGADGAPADRGKLRREIRLLEARILERLKDYGRAEEALSRLLAEAGEALPEAERLLVLLAQGEVVQAAGDPARTLKVLQKALRLLKEDSPHGARLHLLLARVHLERQNVKKAINFCLNGLKICQKQKEAAELPELYEVLARGHGLRGDSAHAVDCFQRALEWFEARGRKHDAAQVLDDLGRVYLEQGNFFRAARYLYKSLEIKRREGDIVGLSRSYDELGRVYLRTGDELKTIEHLNRSLALKERVGDLAGLNPTLGTLGDLYFRMGQFQRAIRYFKRQVDSSQARSDTRGLVDAFLHLGWVYLELGELKQVENLSKQITILSGEFKLRAQEAEGARLLGTLHALTRDWSGAEKHLRQAIEVHSKLGDRRREAQALLGLAEIKFNRELHDESLKLATKGQVIAEALKALDLQAQTLVVKGNVYRFLKGGSAEKAKELLARALEIGQSLNDARLLFDIFYSLAKVYHYDREFAEAGNFYAKAEAILRRLAEGLPEDMAARFFEDRRRKLFFEDAARFRKEVQSRTASGAAIDLSERSAAVDLKEKLVGVPDYKDLTARLLRLHGSISELDYCDRVLGEALELSKAERGLVLRVQSRQYSAEASSGFGSPPSSSPDFAAAQALAEEAVRRGRTILCGGADEEEKLAKLLRLSGPIHRAVLAVPILTTERVFGALYLDRSFSLGRFTSRDIVMAEAFASHAGCSFENRRQYETAIREPVTGFYTPTYFLERLKDAFRWHNLHGRPFHLLGFYLPGMEDSVVCGGGDGQPGGQKVAQELAEVLPRTAAASWWNPVLAVLLFEADAPAVETLQARITERLSALFKEEVEQKFLGPEARFPDGAAMYYELRRILLPDQADAQAIAEIRRLLARDLTLKEAKKVLEKHIIESTLRKTGGNITHAAKELGIHRPQLSNLLKKYALKRELFERNFDLRLDSLEN